MLLSIFNSSKPLGTTNLDFNQKVTTKKNRNGLLALLATFLCASISYGQQPYVKRVNCGGVAVQGYQRTQDGEIVDFDADDGNGYTYTGENRTTAGHGNFTLDTNPGQIFALTRFTKNPASMQYHFDNAPDGDYKVTLHWAEPYHGPNLAGTGTFTRQFDVNINGNPVETNLCVYDEVGANVILEKTYDASATGGNGIVIDFMDTGNNDPIINAIEVVGVDPGSGGGTGGHWTQEANNDLHYTNGNVGIGTSAPDDLLTVKGRIHAQEVKVDLLGALAPDYVFLEGYELRTLEEVEESIRQNGHLPNIPSAGEMEENGVELKMMNLKLLEKVEELTLYLIQQNKNQKLLEERIQLLESAIKK